MDFRTELNIRKSSWTIAAKDAILTAGSCFSQSMGDAFAQNKFRVLINPFGTTYHPLALDRLLSYSIQQTRPPVDLYVSRDGIQHHFDFHSSFSAPSQKELEAKLQETTERVDTWIRACRVLILTYGTAWQFTHLDSGKPVANCHKMPSTGFSRKLISAKEIIASFESTYHILKEANPDLKIILTVSPVRHLKDSLELNSVSKAVLRVAAHHLVQTLEGVEYFPAFEIMIDDLRDYRYYADDMLHPTRLAEDYIWQKFSERYFANDTLELLSSWGRVRQALMHRPFHPESKGHLDFLRTTLNQLEQLKGKLDVDSEIADLRRQLQELSLS